MLDFYAITDIGNRRERNEDAVFADAEHALFLVADGVGGSGSGDVASAVARSVFQGKVKEGKSLRSSTLLAHKAVLLASQTEGRSGKMGTTIAALKLFEKRYEIAWAGDCRIYLQRAERLRCLTTDHTFVQNLLDDGVISPEEAKVHPNRNVVTRVLGAGREHVEPDCHEAELREGDLFLLCSDGLHGELSDEQIEECLALDESAEFRARRLLDLALSGPAKDNLSAIVVAFGEASKAHE